MFLLDKIKLSKKGIIVFGARPGMGLSINTLKIANKLAKSENVVFVSYQTFKDKLINTIKYLDKSISPKLIINTDLKFFDYDFYKEIDKLIENNSAKTIILDDLDDMLGESFNLQAKDRDKLILELNTLAKKRNMRIILNYRLTSKLEHRVSQKPILQDFTWSRNLIEQADQVYSIYRPEYYGIVKTLDFESGEECSTKNRLEIQVLKNGNYKEEEKIFYFKSL